MDTHTDNTEQRVLPCISVVIIGRNEGERLRRCLRSIREADYPAGKIELIYVDTDSTDDSREIAGSLGAKVVAIKPERPSAAAARNAGLRVASHELVHFFDGDTIVNKAWFEKAAAAIKAPGVVAVSGRREELAPAATVYNFWMHHDWYAPPGRRETCGGDVLFRRDALLKAGGYDASLIAGEERDLCTRLTRDDQAVIVRLDEPMTLHDGNMTRFGQYWRRCFRSGYAYAQVSARYSGLRRWRWICLRNMTYAIVTVVAMVVSLGVWSIWPLGVWVGLLVMAIARDAVRCEPQVGRTSDALLYAAHHYLSKVPTIMGHLAYYRRHLWGGRPQELVEYRGEAERRADESDGVLRASHRDL